MGDLYDENISTDMIYDIMRETANNVIGAYMSKLYKTDDPELERELDAKVDKVWDARAACDPTDREGMIDIIVRLREELQEFRRGQG